MSNAGGGWEKKSFDLKNIKITLIVNVNAENEGRNQWWDSIFPLILPSCSYCDDDKWFYVYMCKMFQIFPKKKMHFEVWDIKMKRVVGIKLKMLDKRFVWKLIKYDGELVIYLWTVYKNERVQTFI